MENQPQPVPTEEPRDETNSVEELKGDVVNFSGQVKEITAQTVNFSNGGAGAIKGETVTVRLKDGGIGAVIAQKADITVEDGGIGTVIAREATVKAPVVPVVIAMNVTGENTKIMFDMRAGLLAGVAAGLVLTALRMLLGHRK
jgi:hypothetical protein